MPITVDNSKMKEIDIVPAAALDWLAAQAIGLIQRRTARGQSLNGGAFAQYSASYQKQLAKGGESTLVDLTVTGGLLADIKELRRTVSATQATVTIGLGTGTSENRRAKSVSNGKLARAHAELQQRLAMARTLYSRRDRESARAAAHEGFAKSTRGRMAKVKRGGVVQRGPAHNVVGAWIHKGTPKMPARPFLGLTRAEAKPLILGALKRAATVRQMDA